MMWKVFAVIALALVVAQGVSAAREEALANAMRMLDHAAEGGSLRAGVSKVNASLPIGAPLAPYNFGDRRVKDWPLPKFTEYTTWQVPSVGRFSATWVRALAIDDGETMVMVVSVDVVGMDDTLSQAAYDRAVDMGFDIPLDHIMFCASHTHSGPGGITSDFVFQVSPSTDVYVPILADMFAESMADAMVSARNNMTAVKLGTGHGLLTNVTKNRRASFSPYVNSTSIDPNLMIIRVDDAATGAPMATVWNFAIHGTCFYDENLYFDGDISGGSCKAIEELVGGVALFVNADAGDIAPTGAACAGKPNFAGAPWIAAKVKETRDAIVPLSTLNITTAATVFDWGPTDLNSTLSRVDNCTTGGYLDICTICEVIDCDANIHLPSSWIHDAPLFNAFRFSQEGKETLITSIPGEALSALGTQIRDDGLALGFDEVMLFGYSNNYLCYFATPDEYDVGGYESAMTWWGISTAERVRSNCHEVSSTIAPINDP